MLMGAAVAHRSASIPLLAIGGGWLIIGLLGLRQGRRTARKVQLSEGVLSFTFPRHKTAVVPLSDVSLIRPGRGDINRMSQIVVEKKSGNIIRVAPRMQGLFDLLVEVRRLNPDIQIGNF